MPSIGIGLGIATGTDGEDPNVTVVLSSTVNPTTYLLSTTFNAVVIASITPATGTVEFFDGATSLGVRALVNGACGIGTAALAVGGHTITAQYSGAPGIEPATSNQISQVVNQASTTTSTPTSTVNPTTYNQSTMFSATVTGANGGTPTGTVTFKADGVSIGTGTLSGGVATLAYAGLSVATHSITAVYGGDGNFVTSTSGALTQTTTQASTTTTLASSVNPSVENESTSLTATVSPAPADGDSVSFRAAGVEFGTATTVSGVATLSFSWAAGHITKALTAVFAGDVSYAGSTSNTVTQTVWNPLNLSTLVEFIDAADPNLVVDGSTNVQTWPDQAGVMTSYTATLAGTRPAYVASGINGKPDVLLAGGAVPANYLYSDTTNHISTAATVCVGASVAAGKFNGSGYLLVGKLYTSGSNNYYIGGASTTKARWAVNGQAVNSNSNLDDGTPHLLLGWWDKNASSGALRFRVDGTQQTGTAASTSSITNSDANSIGAQTQASHAGSVNGVTGHIAFKIMCSTALTFAAGDEGALLERWGKKRLGI